LVPQVCSGSTGFLESTGIGAVTPPETASRSTSAKTRPADALIGLVVVISTSINDCELFSVAGTCEAFCDRGYRQSSSDADDEQMIISATPDLVVAFPGGAGTADMVRRARLNHIPVVEYN
jgi:hypothetical protein